jgi:hypothetical protein
MVASAERRASERPLLPLIDRLLLVTTCGCRAGCSIAEGLVRSDRVVDDAESVDLHVQGRRRW